MIKIKSKINTARGPLKTENVGVFGISLAEAAGVLHGKDMREMVLPRMMTVRQEFPPSPRLDVGADVQAELERIAPTLKQRSKIAVGVGSRGISNLQEIVRATIRWLKDRRTDPYIVPAMGSHGGATPEGQTQLLAEYGVTKRAMGVPIRAGMDVECIGKTEDGVDVFCSKEALAADGIIIINRVKPHTDFSSGTMGSGLLKMLVIGLGKRAGAANFHTLASRFGYEHTIRTSSRVTLRRLPMLCGLAIVEDQRHETVRISAIRPQEFEAREGELFVESARLMPKLPFDEIDLLIVDQLGKNISGAGMDPNIIGRGVHGYTSLLSEQKTKPVIGRLFVRELTPESHGNGTGVGLADFATTRLVKAIDQQVTAINSLTALTVQGAKIPIHFDTDREVIDRAIDSLALRDRREARAVRIQSTLALETMQISESLAKKLPPKIAILSKPMPMDFDRRGNLRPIRNGH